MKSCKESAQVDMFAAMDQPVEETDEERERRYWDLKGQAGLLFVQLGECRTEAAMARRQARIKALDEQAAAIRPRGET